MSKINEQKLYMLHFYLNVIYMTDLVEIKYLIIDNLIDKRIKKRIYNENMMRKKKEKKRLMIEQIKKERQENSLFFDKF
jgi:hypothetical protein